jgi:hypothetical protein
MEKSHTEHVRELIVDALEINGAHHKQWYLWAIAKDLGIDLSDQWNNDEKPSKGIAP